MTIKDFARINQVSERQVKMMLPYLEGVTRCPNCNKWIIPKTARPFYIPNKSYYQLAHKKICYILDSISRKFIIHPEISGLTGDDFKYLIAELIKNQYILESKVNDNPYDCGNYKICLEGYNWFEANTCQKNSIVKDVLGVVVKAAPSILQVIQIVQQM